MNRRNFIQSVILGTLSAPFVTRQVKAEAPLTFNGHRVAWDADYLKTHAFCRLYDGYSPRPASRLVRSAFQPTPVQRRIILPLREGQTVPSVFVLVHEIHHADGLIEDRYDYASGPKWWKHNEL